MGYDVPSAIPDDVSTALAEQLKARDALIAREKANRSDTAFRKVISPTAQQACEIVAKIRKEEQETVWRHARTEEGDPELYPGMMFNLAKPLAEKTKLWRIASRMPKGGLLHCHLGATVDLVWLFDRVVSEPGMKFSAATPLTTARTKDRAGVGFCFTTAPSEVKESVWEPDYVAHSWVDASVAADTFPDGGRDGFVKWLAARSSISLDESIQHHLGVDDIWRKFSAAFLILGTVLDYEPILRDFMQKLLHSLAQDGVQWVELRDTFTIPYRRKGCHEPDEDFNGMIDMMYEEVEKFKQTEAGKNFWGARIIWTTLRSYTPEQIINHMKLCIKAKKAHPEIIAGYDLVGQEDQGRTLLDLSPELLWFKKECKKEGLSIPLILHAGECLGDGNSTDHNLYDAILLGSRRIGHAFSLFKHPLLIDMVKEKHILVETCPISNEVLRLSSTVVAHPLPALLSRGVAASLSNDDPALLGQGTSGMTHDFWSALQAWDNLGLAGLGSLAENSVRWGMYEDQTDEQWLREIEEGQRGTGIRAQRMKEWAALWEDFCKWIVDEFGALYL